MHIDAHTDTLGPIQGMRFHHGSPFRNAIEDGLIDPKRMVQIGIRGAHNVLEAWDFCAAHGVRIVFIEEFDEIGVERAVEIARAIVGAAPAYVSFDIDALDPSIAPGTGTPEAGGLTMREAQGLVRGLRGLDLIGADVVEVSPPFDPGTNTALCGATILYELLCILAEARAARPEASRVVRTSRRPCDRQRRARATGDRLEPAKHPSRHSRCRSRHALPRSDQPQRLARKIGRGNDRSDHVFHYKQLVRAIADQRARISPNSVDLRSSSTPPYLMFVGGVLGRDFPRRSSRCWRRGWAPLRRSASSLPGN